MLFHILDLIVTAAGVAGALYIMYCEKRPIKNHLSVDISDGHFETNMDAAVELKKACAPRWAAYMLGVAAEHAYFRSQIERDVNGDEQKAEEMSDKHQKALSCMEKHATGGPSVSPDHTNE